MATITEPDRMDQSFADRVDLVVESSAHRCMGYGDQGGPVVVEQSIRRSLLVPLEPSPRGGTVAGNSVLVELTLTPEGDERTPSSGHRGRP